MSANKHILIIDDEIEICDLLVDFFTKNDFTAVALQDGIKGISYVKNNLPDIVITDLLLPGEHGINVVKAVKNDYFIPVIIISGIYRQEEVNQVMEDYFVEAFFEKPLDLPALLAKVTEILTAKSAE